MNETGLFLQNTAGLSQEDGSFKDGHLICTFKREIHIADIKVFPLTSDIKYYLFLPVGPANITGRLLSSDPIIPSSALDK